MKKVCFFAIKPLRDTEPHVKVYKPPICKNADGTQERQHSNTAAQEIRADRQAVQRRTSVPVRFEFRFVPSSHMAGA